jgi:L-threonylcarbamoyladenylate synthase
MKTIKLTKNNLKKTALLTKEALLKDGLVVVPSDTVYGLASRADSSKAVSKIFDFKGRRLGKGISVFLKDQAEIKKYAQLNPPQEEIIKSLLPGPFTIILPSKHKLAPGLEPRDNSLGIRIINHSFLNELLSLVKFPITATSANLSGRQPHHSIKALLNTLSQKKKDLLSLVVDAGPLPRIPPSTVIRLTDEKIKVLRKGLLNPRLIFTKKTRSEAKTQELAQLLFKTRFRKHLETQPVIVVLQGDLGSGKTVFAKAIGELFGQLFSSPTFILLEEHPINQRPVKNIYHLDLFKIDCEEEILALDLEQFLLPGNLFLIEWGEKLSILKSLKGKKTVFFWLEIRSLGEKERKFKLYQL